MRISKILSVSLTGFLLAGSSCSKSIQSVPTAQNPMVLGVQTTLETTHALAGTQVSPTAMPSFTPAPPVDSTEHQYRITLNKSDILGTEFLYGADLQYSSFYDKEMDLYNQSMAIGHLVARFRIVNDELQLIGDMRRLYPSDVNHPEQLISRAKIISETPTTLIVSEWNASNFLSQVFEATHADAGGHLTVPAAASPKDSWVRTFEFDPKGNYFLQQSSVQMEDGSIVEFMESVFPSANLKPGSQFQVVKMDPDSPVGGTEGIASRFRLLVGEKIFNGEEKLTYAQHFDISNGATIDWYVTSNIPDEFLEPVKEAVEGWNRYFNKYKGISRAVMQFKGRLPEGIHIGDPRFNVINWDSRTVAGAAYESQATDPFSGKQSHSLIYMPAAWVQIGLDYWKTGTFTEAKDSTPPRARGLPGFSAKISCMKDISETLGLLNSGVIGPDEFKTFGLELLKQTLFHEVGHSLGFAHNFKGSLSYDVSKAKKDRIFSNSIMDYNVFEIERAAFSGLHTSDGPELEYDRQFLSALYDNAQDVPADNILPTCNDAEADVEVGGVDPACIRYDVENDPTHSVVTAFNLANSDSLPEDTTLAQAIRNVPSHVITDARVNALTKKEDITALEDSLVNGLKGSLNWFYIMGRTGVLRTVKTNIKSLYEFEDSILPATMSEKDMRDRALGGVEEVLALRSVNDVSAQALATTENNAVQLLLATPYATSPANQVDKVALEKEIRAKIEKVAGAFASDEAAGLAKLRISVLTTLARHKDVPFFFGVLGDSKTAYDIETTVINLLDQTLSNPASMHSERMAAATSLFSFNGRGVASDKIQSQIQKIQLELSTAKDNKSRENAYGLLAVLGVGV